MKHYQKTIFIVFLLLQHCLVSAQVINGIVCDEATKLPIANVHVYLNGTSINAITNTSGEFSLSPKAIINTQLVLSHLSYETAIIDRPFNGLPDTLFIAEQTQTLDEVTVVIDRFSRKQKMKVFREQFLGTSRAGKSCTILNEEDISITYNMNSHRLMAVSDKPIVVVNDYLGYQVSFILMDFWVQYNENIVSLDNVYIKNSFLSVVSLFTDMTPENRNIIQRRDNIYDVSSNNFFKSFVNNTLEDNQFLLHSRRRLIDRQQYFATKDTATLKMISILPATDIEKESYAYFGQKLSGLIGVSYRKNIHSDIFFMTDSIFVDQYGNIDQFDKVSFSGKYGESRAGDMLPIDYEPAYSQINTQ